jgi:hypothetical protein
LETPDFQVIQEDTRHFSAEKIITKANKSGQMLIGLTDCGLEDLPNRLLTFTLSMLSDYCQEIG